ncbi:6953_t:CDS:2 [Entrophospora sp. SA101]|nr:6953_t:CDS:2 [Entrophospora sp. SA101]
MKSSCEPINLNTPRIHPESSMECERFRAKLRSLNFINPEETTSIYKSLDGENGLSEQLKNLSNLAKKAREDYIMEVFYNNNANYLSKPIPITKEEGQQNKMTKKELIIRLESLFELMGKNVQQKYHGFKSKNRSDLLIILQEVRCLLNEENEIDNCIFSKSSKYSNNNNKESEGTTNKKNTYDSDSDYMPDDDINTVKNKKPIFQWIYYGVDVYNLIFGNLTKKDLEKFEYDASINSYIVDFTNDEIFEKPILEKFYKKHVNDLQYDYHYEISKKVKQYIIDHMENRIRLNDDNEELFISMFFLTEL